VLALVALLALAGPPDDHVAIDVFPPITVASKPGGASVRVTVRWPRERDNLVGELGWQYAYPGEGGHSRPGDISTGPRQLVRFFERLPRGVTEFVAQTCIKDTGKCEQARVTVEVK